MAEPLRVGREALSALVAERVMGWEASPGRCHGEPCVYWRGEGEYGDKFREADCGCDTWDPAEDLLSAWEVVERMREKGNRMMLVDIDGEAYGATFGSISGPSSANAPTAPLAICVAALRAVGVEVELALPDTERSGDAD